MRMQSRDLVSSWAHSSTEEVSTRMPTILLYYPCYMHLQCFQMLHKVSHKCRAVFAGHLPLKKLGEGVLGQSTAVRGNSRTHSEYFYMTLVLGLCVILHPSGYRASGCYACEVFLMQRALPSLALALTFPTPETVIGKCALVAVLSSEREAAEDRSFRSGTCVFFNP